MVHSYIIYILGFLLSVLLVLGEARRQNKRRRSWRIIAALIAVLSLVFIIRPPAFPAKTNSPNEIGVVAKGDLFDSLYVTGKDKRQAYIADLSYYLSRSPEIRKINISGFGLNDSDLSKLSGYQLTFKPAAIPAGIISCNWNKQVKFSEPLLVQGTYLNSSSRAVKVILRGFGSNLDSTTIKASQTGRFSLANIPVQSGKALYELVALQGTDTVSKELIPFEVSDPQHLNIIVLAAFPNFEYKFLKAWLFREGHHVILRSRISKDKYSFDFLNTKTSTLKLTSAVLNKTDLLIADEEELDALNADERAAISATVRNGMGLLTRLSRTDRLQKSALVSGFARYESDNKQKESFLSLPASSKPAVIAAPQKLFLRSGPFDQNILTDNTDKVLAAVHLSGEGKVAASTLSATYGWVLNGQSDSYSKCWSELIRATARKVDDLTAVEFIPAHPKKSGSMRFIVQSDHENLPMISFAGVKATPRQNLELPFEWDMPNWPIKEGWDSLTVEKKTFSFFVNNTNAWKSANARLRINKTNSYLAKQYQSIKSTGSSEVEKKAIPIWIFLLVFLMSAGFLWAEPRIFTEKSN
ncbi:hypothetical protein ACXZ1K_08925 [Pedobacter sp. PWIIR3]